MAFWTASAGRMDFFLSESLILFAGDFGILIHDIYIYPFENPKRGKLGEFIE